jgi:hypothetical protein
MDIKLLDRMWMNEWMNEQFIGKNDHQIGHTGSIQTLASAHTKQNGYSFNSMYTNQN